MADAAARTEAVAAVPAGYTVRGASWADLDAVVELANTADIADFGEPDINREIIESDWRLPDMDLAANAWIVRDAHDAVVGHTWVHVLGELPAIGWGVVHPEHRGRGIGAMLVDVRERRARELLAGRPGGHDAVHLWIPHADDAARALLETRGYRPVRHFWDMQIRIDGAVPPADIPDGITVRGYVKGPDDRAVHQAIEESFEDHWQHHAWTFEEWSERRFTESFDPTLWWVAVAGDDVAGALLGSVSDGIGWVNTLGVRRPWRRRGLGEALLRLAFAEFARRGIADVRLGVDAANPTGATRLYERVGMHVHRQFDVYEKEV